MELGQTVYDPATDTLIIVERRLANAGEIELPNRKETIAEYNGAPKRETVYGCVFKNEFEQKVENWKEINQTNLLQKAKEKNIKIYTYPESRLLTKKEKTKIENGENIKKAYLPYRTADLKKEKTHNRKHKKRYRKATQKKTIKKQQKHKYKIQIQNGGKYTVTLKPHTENKHRYSCTCPDFKKRKMTCKHIYAVAIHKNII